MTTTRADHLEQVTPATSEDLQHAVSAFVEARRALSDADVRPSWFQAWKSTVDHDVFVDRSRGGGYACWPVDTMATVLPFFDFKSDAMKPPRPALVPVRFVVGSSWNWHEGSLPSDIESTQTAIDLFTSDQCARDGEQLCADVAFIAPLGLFYVSGEGKNRVAFLARHGIEYMPCKMSERDYPAAERLRLVYVREGPLCCWLCVLDDEHAVTIPYPEFTLPILRAYGVKQVGWAKHYPLLETVMNSFRLQPADGSQQSRSGASAQVSFSHLKSREAAATDVSSDGKSLVQHPDLILDARYVRGILVTGFALLAASGVLRLVGVSQATATSLAALVVGAILGAFLTLFVPVTRRPENLSKSALARIAADGSNRGKAASNPVPGASPK